METVCKGCELCREALLSDPDPRPIIRRRILSGTLHPDWTTNAEVFQWIDRQRTRHTGVQVTDDDGEAD